VNTAREHKTGPAQTGQLALAREFATGSSGREEETAHQLANAGPDSACVGVRRPDGAARRADERAPAVRSVDCPCQARPGTPCGPSGDHLARYLRAEQSGAITRESLKEVIADLDVIAAHVMIQPPGERTAHATGAQTADQVIRAQMDAGMTPDRIETSAESVLGGRFDHPTPTSEAFYRGYDEVAATYAREARELEAGE
jgi:hypothetical protein